MFNLGSAPFAASPTGVEIKAGSHLWLVIANKSSHALKSKDIQATLCDAGNTGHHL